MSKRKQPLRAALAAPRDEDWPDESDDSGDAGDDELELPARRRRRIVVLHQDEDLVIVDKPAGTMIEAGFEGDPSVFEQLAGGALALQSSEGLRTVFPLDTEASGLLLVAKRQETADGLRQRLAGGTLEICHLAIVRGRVVRQTGTIDRPVAPPLAERPPRIDDRHGQPAVTGWRVRDSFVGFSLLECRPRTAVAGQIRVHLISVGMPPAVDALCGGAEELRLSSFKADYRHSRRRPERPLIARLTLHAASVRLPHPRTGAELRFESPLPKDFRAALYQLNKYGRLPPA